MIKGIFESHAHYDDSAFDEDRDELISSLPEKGIEYAVNIGNDYSSIKAGIELADKYPFIYATVGHHPITAREVKAGYLDELAELCRLPKVVAIGEIGLDYHYLDTEKHIQKRVFEEQLSLAKELDMPVVIHSREAVMDTMELLHKYKPQGVVHCFSGSSETAKEVVALGMYIGFTGVVTFSNANKAVEAAAAVPLERLLIETDCPYMAPVPLRGKRNDSSNLVYIIEKLAEIKNISPQELADITNRNAKNLYRIK